MQIAVTWLENKIEELISIIEKCRDSTTFDEERKLYDRNIEMAREGLIDLKTKSYQEVIDVILSPYTDKYFGDYWKHEPWGRIEMEALVNLQVSIKNRF